MGSAAPVYGSGNHFTDIAPYYPFCAPQKLGRKHYHSIQCFDLLTELDFV